MSKNTDEKADDLTVFTAKDGETLLSLRLTACFSKSDAPVQIAEVGVTPTSDAASELPKRLIIKMLESNLLTMKSLRSILPTLYPKKAGRPRVKLNKNTGKIEGISSTNQGYVRSWQEGKTVEEIAQIALKTLKKRRTPETISIKIGQIRRILRKYKGLLNRKYQP